MPEEEKVLGETTEQTTETGSQEESQSIDVSTNQENEKEVNNATFEDGEKPKKQQSKEDNSRFARERREKELKEKIYESEMNATFKALGGVNPYSNEPMKDKTDYEEYLNMREMKENGLDPMMDYSKYQKEKARQRQLELQKQEELNLKAQAELNGFREKNPNVDISELLKDEDFVPILRGVDGSITKAYEIFNRMQTKFQDKANIIAAQSLANAKANVGSLTENGGETTPTFFTKEQVEKMTKEEVKKNYDAIMNSITKW